MPEKRFDLQKKACCPKPGQLKTSAYNDFNLCLGIVRGDLLLDTLLRLFPLLALRHNRGTQSHSQIVGQFVKLRVAINLDGLLRGIADYVAVVAPSQVVLEFGFCPLIEYAV
jgi:hypothetical protein